MRFDEGNSLYHIGILNGLVAQSVGRTYTLVTHPCIFLKSTEEIVVRNLKSSIFFYYI